MTPKRKGNPEQPSSDKLPLEEQYEVPKESPDDLKVGITNFCDLTLYLPDWCSKETNGSSRS